ncbi:gfo/Idh/MocA family oxidoreductase, partial [Desertibacillus haloalkaliphilus]|nr:gfo/Idh/MocA family oxidoreductase [Desertibacillus haloalkaliphilus]
PTTFEVEDSAFGFIKMEDGATIFLESSWVLNTTDAKEAATTLCGTKAGAEITSGMGKKGSLIINKAAYGELVTEEPTIIGGVDFFDAKHAGEAVAEAKQWLESIINDTEPLVKP